MKILAALLLFVSSFVNAQCLVASSASAAPAYIRVCESLSTGFCDNATAYWSPYNPASSVFTLDTLETCTGYWIPSAAEVKQQQSLGVTPEGFLQAFTFGITLYLTFWYGPFLVGLAKQLIRKI
jgi:hypothetical protein